MYLGGSRIKLLSSYLVFIYFLSRQTLITNTLSMITDKQTRSSAVAAGAPDVCVNTITVCFVAQVAWFHKMGSSTYMICLSKIYYIAIN